MQVYINGEFRSAEEAVVSAFDRGFLYGDGCFETIRVHRQKPAFWREHVLRLGQTLKALAIPYVIDPMQLAGVAQRLIETNGETEAVLRIQVTRGCGERGYSIAGANTPTVVLSLHPLAPPAVEMKGTWRLKKSAEAILTNGILGQFKTSNKLLQVMGKAEADAEGVDDVVFTTEAGFVAETSSANIFWFEEDTLITPGLEAGVLAGITRAIVLEIWESSGRRWKEKLLPFEDLARMEPLFLTQSVWGIISVTQLNEQACSTDPRVDWLRTELEARMNRAPFP